MSRSASGEVEPSYPLLSRSKTLAHATDDAALIRKTAIALWDAAEVREPIRLLGVSLSQLQAHGKQLDLFGDRKESKLGAAMDAIKSRFGEGKIGRAIDAPKKATPSLRAKSPLTA